MFPYYYYEPFTRPLCAVLFPVPSRMRLVMTRRSTSFTRSVTTCTTNQVFKSIPSFLYVCQNSVTSEGPQQSQTRGPCHWKDDEMAECDSCSIWYHHHCMDIPSEVFDEDSDVCWECKRCVQPLTQSTVCAWVSCCYEISTLRYVCTWVSCC